MTAIETINPEKFLKRSTAESFWILLVTENEHLAWAENEFRKIEIDGIINLSDVPAYRREEVIDAYNRAVRHARGTLGGHLKIAEVPI